MVPKNIHLLSVQCAAAKVRELAKMAIDKRVFKRFLGQKSWNFLIILVDFVPTTIKVMSDVFQHDWLPE